MLFRFFDLYRPVIKQIPLRILRGAVLFQYAQLLLRATDDALRHTGQRSDLQAVALAGCTFVDAVQEHDAVLVFDGGEMDVGELLKFFVQTRELKVVGGKQGVATVAFQ